MNRSELVDAISQRTGLAASQVDTVLRGFNDVVAQVDRETEVIVRGRRRRAEPGHQLPGTCRGALV